LEFQLYYVSHFLRGVDLGIRRFRWLARERCIAHSKRGGNNYRASLYLNITAANIAFDPSSGVQIQELLDFDFLGENAPNIGISSHKTSFDCTIRCNAHRATSHVALISTRYDYRIWCRDFSLERDVNSNVDTILSKVEFFG